MSVESAGLFCFEIADPLCHLAAERVLQAAQDRPLTWLPVSASSLPAGPRAGAFRCQAEVEAFQEDVERRAARLGLQPIRWPAPFPFDSELAMLAATYAREIGRAVPFAQAALRQAFAGGHALDREDFVLIAAAACEMHPRAVLGAMRASSTAARLQAAGELAAARGVDDLPAVVTPEQTLCGEQALEWIFARALPQEAQTG
jgi:2-hydroxychromene-2-carboxylate isomerase